MSCFYYNENQVFWNILENIPEYAKCLMYSLYSTYNSLIFKYLFLVFISALYKVYTDIKCCMCGICVDDKRKI